MSEQQTTPTPDPKTGGTTERSNKPTPPPSTKPPRAVGVGLLLGVALIAVLLIGVGVATAPYFGSTSIKDIDTARKVIDQMNREQAIDSDAFSQVTQALDKLESEQVEEAAYYTCGMHPWIVLPNPGNCPICQMTLTPLDPSKFSGEVTIDPLSVQNIGVRVGEVITGPLVKTIRTVGTVDYDEPLVRDINIKVNGWVEELYVDYLGKQVQQGQKLFSLYSPELYSAQEEYLLAYRNHDKVGADFVPDAAQGATDLLDAARTRLLYYDITPQQIDELEQADAPTKTMTLRSPYSGVVIQKHANEGMKVNPGMRIYRIADLSKVWVLVTLYEYQLPYVQTGQDAVMTLPYIPGQRFEGKVVYIYPYLDKKTREVQVRLEFDNADGLLKPGMFANVALQNTLARERTLAPREAIIDTGERKVAFVSFGEGKFEPREVLVGIANGDGMVEVLDGLEPGEIVVTSGQFLIDSEANIRESLAKMIRGDMASEQKPKAQAAGASQLTTLPDPVAEALNGVMDAYLKIGDALAGDSIDNINNAAQQVADGLTALTGMQIPDEPNFWSEHDTEKAMAHALKLGNAADIEEARLRFADLSITLGSLLKATGVPPSYSKEVQELHCPMYQQGQGGAIWLQSAGDVRNPFLGSVMIDCFDNRAALPVTGQSTTTPDASSTQPSTQPAPDDAGTMDHPNLSTDSQNKLDTIVSAYLSIQSLLAQDMFDGVTQNLAEIHSASATLAQDTPGELADLAAMVASSSDSKHDSLDTFRDSFATLTDAVTALAKHAPPTDDAAPALYLAYCPMVKKHWLQPTDEIKNPYAKSMSACGTITAQIPVRTASTDGM
jgi:membrane fusion protein, copper/silver efflux system